MKYPFFPYTFTYLVKKEFNTWWYVGIGRYNLDTFSFSLFKCYKQIFLVGLELPQRLASGTPEGEPKRKRIVYDNRPRRKKLQQQGK